MFFWFLYDIRVVLSLLLASTNDHAKSYATKPQEALANRLEIVYGDWLDNGDGAQTYVEAGIILL